MEELEDLVKNSLELYRENNALMSMLKRNGIPIHNDSSNEDHKIQMAFEHPVELTTQMTATA